MSVNNAAEWNSTRTTAYITHPHSPYIQLQHLTAALIVIMKKMIASILLSDTVMHNPGE